MSASAEGGTRVRHLRARGAGTLVLALALLLPACARGAGGATPPASGSGGGGTIDPPTGGEAPPFLPGLRALAPDLDSIRFDLALPREGYETALFLSEDSGTVYEGAPALEGIDDTAAFVGGLATDTRYHAGLAVRPAGTQEWTPVGLVLVARTGAPVYVDAAADPSVADGTSPGTAYADIFLGMLAAIIRGGANVWVEDGDYTGAGLPLDTGVHVYGGFGEAFDLATRDALGGGTVVHGQPGAAAFVVQGTVSEGVLDGVVVAGDGMGLVGVEVIDANAQLRGITVQDFVDRGVRIQNGSQFKVDDVLVASAVIQANGADGIHAVGGLNLRIDGSSLDANVQEGLECDDLIALDGREGTLLVLGSRFLGNGAEGLDCDLAAPLAQGSQGGTFDIRVEGSLFEGNADVGLLLDQDYELVPLWDGAIAVRGCTVRGNGKQGLRVDADAPATVLLHRVLAAGNAGDGIWISSESDAGLVVVSTSVCLGNRGVGLRASLGNKAVAATHLVLAGNLQGGFHSDDVESSAASSVAYLQIAPWANVRRAGCVEVDDPFDGSFERTPEAFAAVLAVVDDVVTLDSLDAAVPGLPAELADDGIARTVVQVASNTATLDPAPDALRLPALFLRFGPGGDDATREDWHLPPGSPIAGLGLSAPGAPPVDPGPWGSPVAGTPGLEEPAPGVLFPPLETTPALTDGIDQETALAIAFPAPLDPVTVGPGSVRAVTASGSELAIGLALEGDELVVSPPPEGWGAEPVTLELHRALASDAGEPLATPLILPLVPR